MLSRGVMEDCEGIYNRRVYTLTVIQSMYWWPVKVWCMTARSLLRHKESIFLELYFFPGKKDHSTLHAHLCLCLSFVPSHNNSTAICWLFQSGITCPMPISGGSRRKLDYLSISLSLQTVQCTHIYTSASHTKLETLKYLGLLKV